MKILFLIGATSRIRNFDEAILMLADRGHSITLAGRLRKGSFDISKSIRHERVRGRVNPTERGDAWRAHVDLLRGARDYVRYLDPRFAGATRLVRRAHEIAPTEVAMFCQRHPWVQRHWNISAAALSACEDLIPSDPTFEAFLRDEQPDLIVVTPLVTFESYQTDYVKAAHALAIPVVFIPFSWDNLTNKGLMRVHPDRVLVWNDVQRREAIELHGCRPETVVITGAARFDSFFRQTVSSSRADFMRDFGLDADRPMVLYLGSSQLTGPNEMELVQRWAESLRSADDERVRTCGIVIRPHPAVRTSWTSLDLSRLGNIGVSLDASRGGDHELYDSIHHAHSVVGLNTSAMLEAAVVGRPVHTLVIPGFDEGQVGTMHFHYLVEAYGGLATIARDFAEHQRQLAGVLRQPPAVTEKSRTFAQKFLRPHGIDRAVSPLLAEAIEQAGRGIRKRARLPNPLHAPLRLGLHAWLRNRGGGRHSAVDATVIGTSLSLRAVKTALEEIRNGTSPVFVGPWVDTVGHELLYWIPFVRWIAATYGLPAERLIVVSDGGLRDWYGSIAQRFVDARTLFSAAELDEWRRRTVPQSQQERKQTAISPFDTEILERAARALDLTDYQVLHPVWLFRTLHRLEADAALPRLGEILQYEPRGSTVAGSRRAVRGASIAMSTAFTEALPESEPNREFLARLSADVLGKGDVVNLDGLPVDAQAEAVTHARTFVGPYGDLAILAAFCGTSAVTFHSERLPADHLERLKAASEAAGWATVTAQRTHRFKEVRLPEAAHA